MVKSCDSTLALSARHRQNNTRKSLQCSAGSIMDMKAQDSRSDKALGIGELLASACSASAPVDQSLKTQGSRRRVIQAGHTQMENM